MYEVKNTVTFIFFEVMLFQTTALFSLFMLLTAIPGVAEFLDMPHLSPVQFALFVAILVFSIGYIAVLLIKVRGKGSDQ